MHFTPNIYCSFKLDEKDNASLVTTTRDKLEFVIPCRKISPSDNCQCCQQEDASSFEKKRQAM